MRHTGGDFPNELFTTTSSGDVFHPITGEKLPSHQFLVRTVLLSNMTVIHNGIENFKEDMERKLTSAYRHAYVVNRYKREAEAEGVATEKAEEGGGSDEHGGVASDEVVEGSGADEHGGVANKDSEEKDGADEQEGVASDIVGGGEDEKVGVAIENSEEADKEGVSSGEKREERAAQMVVNTPFSTTEIEPNMRQEWPRVKIHNIRSSLPEPEIEMIYTVSKGKEKSVWEPLSFLRRNLELCSFFSVD